MKSFYKIFWLVSVFLLISCGDNSAKKETETLEPGTVEESVKKDNKKVILFFGNSLTAGMGLDQNEGFPAVIQEKIDSLGMEYNVVNAGLSGETTASGSNRVDWVLNQEVDIFVLELGANDGLRGIPLEETRKNLQKIIDVVREKNPDVKIVLAGMQIPPNLGPEYTSDFKRIFPELVEKNNIEFIPFLLEGVAGRPELNQEDGIHPTAEGQEIVAKNVWEVLKPIL